MAVIGYKVSSTLKPCQCDGCNKLIPKGKKNKAVFTILENYEYYGTAKYGACCRDLTLPKVEAIRFEENYRFRKMIDAVKGVKVEAVGV